MSVQEIIPDERIDITDVNCPITFVKPPRDAISIIPDHNSSIPAIVVRSLTLSSAPVIIEFATASPLPEKIPYTTEASIIEPKI